MSKIYYYMTITVGLAILMKFAGIPFAGQDTLINLFGLDPNNITTANTFFITTLIAAFVVAAATGSFFSKESSIRAGFIVAVGFLGVGIGTFIGILGAVKNATMGASDQWIYYLTFLVFAIYIVGYIIALIGFWGGNE
jgi:hypothetical protein